MRVAAVDLGATSGRVMTGRVGPGELSVEESHRFPNGGVAVHGSLFWDVLGLYREMLAGLRAVARAGPLDGIGIDTWAVDYGLLDRDGALLGNPHTHRDPRTAGIAERVLEQIGPEELYAVTGLQQLPFSTLYQLVAASGTAALESAQTLLLLPDLLAYWLTGEVGAERTNASTTQLYDVRTGTWAVDLATRLGVPWSILPPLRSPGTVIGPLLADVAADLGVDPGIDPSVPVIAVGSHDTASAVVGSPMDDAATAAYVSSGTWSLVGLELEHPVLTDEARQADFTNEGGVDGTIRFLKNVMGLWVLSESVRAWGADLPELLRKAGAHPGGVVVDIDDRRLMPVSTPADPMPARVVHLARDADQALPPDPVDITRCILDSLALAYRRHLRTAARLADRELRVVHVVGGGSRNELLCQLTADACGLPVFAGPAEAAALGNILVQARALGADLPDLGSMRTLLRQTQRLRRYEPRDTARWERLEDRLGARTSRIG